MTSLVEPMENWLCAISYAARKNFSKCSFYLRERSTIQIDVSMKWIHARYHKILVLQWDASGS